MFDHFVVLHAAVQGYHSILQTDKRRINFMQSILLTFFIRRQCKNEKVNIRRSSITKSRVKSSKV